MTRWFLALFCVVTAAAAQPTDSKFWETPGETIRDAKGNVTYQEIKDPKTFTMRVFRRGQWLTYRYRPNTDKPLRVEGPDTSEDYLYDRSGWWEGVLVHTNNQSLKVRATQNGIIEAEGLPAITLLKDEFTRDYAMKFGNDVVATITYGSKGEVSRLNVGDFTLDLAYDGAKATQTLRANGRVLVTRTLTLRRPPLVRFPFSLDIAAEQLGIAPDWNSGKIRPRWSATETLATFADEKNRPVLRMVQFGGLRVAYDPAGHPLFYDVDPYLNNVGQQVTPNLGVIPTRIVINARGEVGAYVESADDGAISSFWSTTDAGGHRQYSFRIFHSGAKSAPSLAPTGESPIAQMI